MGWETPVPQGIPYKYGIRLHSDGQIDLTGPTLCNPYSMGKISSFN